MPELLHVPELPKMSREQILAILKAHGITDGFALVGIRGFFKDMGVPGKNDRGIYDDALFVITPSAFVAFNFNVDPSAHKPGIANLKPGKYLYKLGIHGLSKPKDKQYKALVQAAPVTVIRDGGKEETGYFGLNLHKGYNTTTGSLGCQTVPQARNQWAAFIALVEAELKRHGRTTIPYVLTA